MNKRFIYEIKNIMSCSLITATFSVGNATTAAYNVTVKDARDISEIDNIQINIYIGINPNIL